MIIDHAPLGRHDETSLLWWGDTVIAVGYVCRICKKSVFPLGSVVDENLLTEDHRRILKDGETCTT